MKFRGFGWNTWWNDWKSMENFHEPWVVVPCANDENKSTNSPSIVKSCAFKHKHLNHLFNFIISFNWIVDRVSIRSTVMNFDFHSCNKDRRNESILSFRSMYVLNKEFEIYQCVPWIHQWILEWVLQILKLNHELLIKMHLHQSPLSSFSHEMSNSN